MIENANTIMDKDAQGVLKEFWENVTNSLQIDSR